MKLEDKINLIKLLLKEVVEDFDKGSEVEQTPHLKRRYLNCKQIVKTLLFNNFGENQPHSEEDYELRRNATLIDKLKYLESEETEIEINTIYYDNRSLSINDHIEIPGHDELTELIKNRFLSFSFILIGNQIKIKIDYQKIYIFSLNEIYF